MAERRDVDWPAGAQAREDSRARQEVEDSNSVLGRTLPQQRGAQLRLALQLPEKSHAVLPVLQSKASPPGALPVARAWHAQAGPQRAVQLA